MTECKCDMRSKLVGDGCAVCNPAKACEYAIGTIEDVREELATTQRKLAEAEAMLAAAIEDGKQNPWKRVVIDGLIVSHIYTAEDEHDADKAMDKLIRWECGVAIDPKVSKAAYDLLAAERERTKQECIQIAKQSLRNCGLLASNPPQSSAAWDICNGIEALK